MEESATQEPTPPSPSPRPKRRRLLWWFVPLLVLLVVGWIFHPPLLSKGLRYALVKGGELAGLRVDAGTIQARFFHPIVIEKLRVRSVDPTVSLMAADLPRVEISLNAPWRFFGDAGRIIQSLKVQGGRSVLDFRTSALPPPEPLPKQTKEKQREDARNLLRVLPQRIVLTDVDLEVLADDQVYQVWKLSASFDEAKLGSFHALGAEVRTDFLNQSLGALKASTAWKDGSAYLSGLDLREGITVDAFEAHLARPGGVSLSLEASVFGGSLRGGITYAEMKDMLGMEVALWAARIDLGQLARFLGLGDSSSGTLREARLTFRGLPDDLIDAEVSARIAADGLQWNNRGWETFEAGASLINRRLVLNEFHLQQKDNLLVINGETTLSENWAGFLQTPFLLNVSGEIQDLGALAGLVGPPFDEMHGRMTLRGSLSGTAAKPSGYLSAEASGIGFRERTIESFKADVLFSGGEAQVSRCEIWSEGDQVLAKGSFEIAEPHNYQGEIQARFADISSYAWLFRAPGAESLYAGNVQLRWQGDGTWTAHSGAFQVSVEDFISDFTPTGLTGRAAGTYSPQNIYFSGLELQQGNLQLSTRITLAESGVKLETISLTNGKRQLAEGEVFLPLDPFAIMAGKNWGEAVDLQRPLHVRLATKGELALSDIFDLIGQQPPLAGSLTAHVDVAGKPEALTMKGSVLGTGLTVSSEAGKSPAARLEASIEGADGTATLSGTLAAQGFPAARLQGRTPFGLRKADDGTFQWINPEGALEVRAEFPRTDIGIFQPFVPQVTSLRGVVSGSLDVSGTAGKPVINGQVALENGGVVFSPRVPSLANLNGTVRFTPEEAILDRLTGEVGAGPFTLQAKVNFSNPENPTYDLTFSGQKILLVRSSDLRLRANIDLKGAGDNTSGSLTGSVALVDGRIYRRLEITPLLAPSPLEDDRLYTPPQVDGLVPPPFANWKVDVAIRNETPFLLVGNIASGSIDPNLRIVGTLGGPRPVGQVNLTDTRAFLPFSTLLIKEGHINFVESDPWIPLLDVRGSSEILDYDVQAYAFGPLNEGRLILRSDPPLPQEAIILLLTTGFAPGYYSGSGFGEAAAGQGGMLLLRAFARQFEWRGVDVDSFLNRLQVTSVPPQTSGGRPTLRARFRVYDQFSLMSEQDELGFYNVGATYRFQFR